MTPVEWLESAAADAARRGLPDARPVLEGLARAAGLLRAADWNEDASGGGWSGAPASAPAR
jgi:hypothetical protein